MPGRIIALYVLLIIRVLANGSSFLANYPAPAAPAKAVAGFAMLEFGLSLFIIISLYFKKPWVIRVFRGYMAIAVPLTLGLMWIGAKAAAQRGQEFPWHQFYGGAIAAAFFLWFAWYVGRAPTPDYLAGRWRDTTPP